MAISHCYWHLVVKNGNFTLLLTSSDQELQFHIATDIQWSGKQLADLPQDLPADLPPKCIMGYILWDVFSSHFILQEKVGISCDFWIIRVVNSQLALYSHVRCNPPWHPQHPQNTPNMTITNFNYEGSYLPGVICNIVVKADFGRSPGTCNPPGPDI